MFVGDALTCAVSGGPDSLALLALASASGATVHAVHVDHGLRPGSDREAAVVAEAAERCGAAFSSVRVEVAPGPNVEARARDARYAALPPDVLTGHTADDQAETMLLALLRGSAWQGLAAMSPTPQRPMLQLRRSDTERLVGLLGWNCVDDPSNHDPAHRRNRVRHELLPLMADIAERDLVPVLVRQAELFRDGSELIGSIASELDPTDADAVAAAPPIVAREAIRRWLWSTCGWPHPPDLATVDRVRAVAALSIRATDVGGGWRVERTQRRLRIVAPARG